MATFHFIYKTTCLVTNEFYIGQHSTKDPNDSYLGSGIILKRSVAKYGRDKHIREILEYCPDRKSLAQRESEIVTENLVKDTKCMNLLKGGTGGFDDRMRELSRLKIRELLTDDKFRAEYSKAMAKNGAKVSPEGRKACSETLKKLYKDPEFKAKQKENFLKATHASWTPEARAKRAANRLAKLQALNVSE